MILVRKNDIIVSKYIKVKVCCCIYFMVAMNYILALEVLSKSTISLYIVLVGLGKIK